MAFIVRHLVYFTLHFAIGWAVVVAICCGFAFYEHGMAYRLTPQFAAQLNDFFRIGLWVAGLYCLVLLGYKTTRGALDPPPDDGNLF